MSEIYESNETTDQQNDVITINLEEIKEPSSVKEENTKIHSDVITIKPSSVDLKKTDNHIIKTSEPENIFIQCVENLYLYIICIHHEKITPLNIIIIATELMQVVEKYKDLATGQQKKMLVINVIKKMVNNQVDSDETQKILNTIIDFTLPIVIDNLVSAINGDMKFNKEKVESFFKKYIFCCFNKK